MTFEEFTIEVNRRYRQRPAEPPEQRHGQYVFNTLHEVRPDIAKELRTTEADPFYLDERIPQAFDFIRERW